MIELNQQQNEALVRLLILAKYQDGNLSLKEDEDFDRRIAELSWSSGTELGLFIDTATAEVREASESDEQLNAFMKEQCRSFTDRESQDYVHAQILGVIQSDGVAGNENKFSAAVRSCLEMA